MTALCGGGTSSARAGFGASVSVGIAQLAALLNNVPTPIAFTLAGYLGLIGYELSTFCASDPPAMPAITGGDWASALLLVDPVAHLAALQKFQNMFANLLWPTFCKCDAGVTPATPALPTPPANLPTVQPPQLPGAPLSSPCWDLKSQFTYIDPTDPATLDLAQYFIPVDGIPKAVNFSQFGPTNAYPIPSGTANAVLNITTHAQSNNNGAQIWLIQYDANGNEVAFQTVNAPNQTTSVALGPASTARYWSIGARQRSTPPGGLIDITSEFTFNCTGTQPSLQLPCCPPDASLQALLQQILSYVELLYQAPSAPHSYADGTVHTGLSGNGTVTLAGAALGIRVNITSDPSSLGTSIGNPTYLFDRGYIVPVVNNAPLGGQSRLVYNPQLFLLPSLTEQIGYSFHPGVVATITEIVAGP